MTAGGLSKPGAALDQPERLDPARDPVEVAELACERGEDREPDQARGLVALLDVEPVADPPRHQHLEPSTGRWPEM